MEKHNDNTNYRRHHNENHSNYGPSDHSCNIDVLRNILWRIQIVQAKPFFRICCATMQSIRQVCSNQRYGNEEAKKHFCFQTNRPLRSTVIYVRFR